MLTHEGHRVIEATDGRSALAVVRAEHPDLVITDVLMPVMDGYEFVRALRLDPAISATAIIFHTGHYDQPDARALALSAGVAAVLEKPAEASHVASLIARVLGGWREAQPAPVPAAFDHDHLRLVTDKLSEKASDLRFANARLRALVNIGLELASERDLDRLLHHVSGAARELFAATSVTVGILDDSGQTLLQAVTCGAESGCQPGDPVRGILETVVRERRTARGENPGGDPVAAQLPGFRLRVRAYLAAPVASPARVYGWICLIRDDDRAFSDDDQQLAAALSGQLGRIYEVESEIVERRRAEDELRRERDRSQRYLDTADVILLALDLEGRITLINRKGCDLLEWREQDLLGRDWISTCLPPRIHEQIRARLRGAVRGDPSVVAVNAVLTRTGAERLIEWRNTLLRDADGVLTGTFSSGADVTERHQAIAALREAEERMRFALEAAGVGIWDMDYTTGVLRWSPILEAQYGLRPGTFEGTFDAFLAGIHPEDRQSVLDTVAAATSAGSDFVVDHRTLWADGTVRCVTGAGRVYHNAAGLPGRAVGVSLDITARRVLEGQLQQAQKMDAIGRLAGGIAHDFNNLLTIILGNCELLVHALGPGDTRLADVMEIRKAGSSAAALTRQLLAFSRKQIIEPTPIDMNEVTADMRVMFERLIGEDVRIVLELRPGLGIVKADRGQMEQIVMNLVLNARDAMPRGGTLTIGTSNVELDEHYASAHHGVTPGSYIALTVTDTGTGMSAGVQRRLFEPFFTTKAKGQGTGLGLATVHGIVAGNGGSVGVYSELGAGTAFKVYLPRVDAAEARVGLPAAAPGSGKGTETVLVVDDVAGLRELTRRLLEPFGYTVLVAEGAPDALRQFEAQPVIDLLLTDVVMPGASGPELTQQLIADRPSLRVLYMSGYAEEAMLTRGVLDAGVAFLHKPFTADSLAHAVRKALDR